MCDTNAPLKLCICDDSVDRKKPHWILHRYVQSKEAYQLMGAFSNPNQDDGFAIRKVKWKIGGLKSKPLSAIINTFVFLLLASFLFSCDLKPIDYAKKTRKSSYVRASTTQTGRLRKAHVRKSISTSKRAFKNRLNARSYYNRNKHRRKLRKDN